MHIKQRKSNLFLNIIWKYKETEDKIAKIQFENFLQVLYYSH